MKRPISRRGFLAGTASLGMGALISPRASARSYRANEKVGVALVGVSGRGSWFVSLLERNDPLMRGVAFCDVDDRRAAAAYGKFPDMPKFKDFRVMLDNQQDIDGVIVATPEFSRALIMSAAIKAGKHVFGEKPLTREPHESRVMRQLALKYDVATQMGNQGSSRTTFQQAKTLVQAGLLGDITEVHVWNNGREPPGDGPRKGGRDLTPPTQSQPAPEDLDWDLWLAGAAHRDYHEMWYGSSGEKWRGNWKRWRDFTTCGLGWAAPHSAALTFLACKIGKLWDATDVPIKDRSIRIIPTISNAARYGFPSWEMVRYEVPARGELKPLAYTWHRGVSHFIEESLAGYPQWKDMRPKPWWSHGGSAFVGSEGTLNATHYGDTWNVYPAELAESELLKGIRGDGHERQWLRAIRGECETASNFTVSGPLNEFLMLGNVATLVNKPFTYDPVTGTVIDNDAAQAALHQEYREGWTL